MLNQKNLDLLCNRELRKIKVSKSKVEHRNLE